MKDFLEIFGMIMLVFISILVIFGVITAIKDRDQAIQNAARSYEDCVIEEYGGRSVMEMYYATGEYPECSVR